MGWLGDQAGALDKTVDLVELYVGAHARLSRSIEKRGGTAIFLGLVWGNDFRRKRDRVLSDVLLKVVEHRHLWIA